jgi:quercetin dioxygenase-like cupin family protein
MVRLPPFERMLCSSTTRANGGFADGLFLEPTDLLVPFGAYRSAILAAMAFVIFHAGALDWEPRGDESGREVARLSDSMTRSRANLWRYPPGARGKRHADKVQEETFVVLEGTLTVDLGEPPERHELERGSVLVVQPGTILQLRNSGSGDVVLFIYGAPPLVAGADFFEDVP